MKINEKEYKLDFTGYTLYIYKQEFNRDLLNELSKFEANNLDVVAILEILWAMAKSVKTNNTPDFCDFLNSITDIVGVMSGEVVNEISQVINKSLRTSNEVKKN